MTLTKSDIVEDLNNEIGLNKREAKELVDMFFNDIKNLLSEGYEVKLSGFGNFQLRNKSARPGRNPRTGENVEVSARKVVTFKSGQKLKESVKALTNEPD
jgi:integration host factor subunit alpha